MESQVTGSGSPVTCFVPGLAQSMADVRPFGSGVSGSRVFYEHAPRDSYAALADDLVGLADRSGATRALGVSLGAAVLVNLLAREPDRFDRVILALPAVLDDVHEAATVRVTKELADAIDANDQIAIGRGLLNLQPAVVRGRTDVRIWARRRASEIGGTSSTVLRSLVDQAPLLSAADLTKVSVPVLVLAQKGDDVHPVTTADRLGELMPKATVMVSDDPWLWSARSRLREVVAGFLNN
jgi:3-oxoadipate enol-lactonase